MKRYIVVSACLICLLLGRPSYAWNKPGHMVSASLAYRNLKQLEPDKLAAWVAILKQHEHFDQFWKPVLNVMERDRRDEALFMLAARWPDDVRGQASLHVRNWHFVDHAIKQAGAPERPSEGQIVDSPEENDEGFQNLLTALDHNLALAADTSRSGETRARALCWVLHLLGDMHQPLHTVSRFSSQFPDGDGGGNRTFISIPPSQTALNYHSFWDGLVLRGRSDQLMSDSPVVISRGIRTASRRAAVLAARPDLQFDDFPQLSNVTIHNWAKEGVEIAKRVGYLDGELTGGDDRLDPFEMPDGFSALAQSVAEQQVALAGFRMAIVLASID